MTTNKDTEYMRLALKLAWKGIGSVEPNPAVGCVIVKNGKIIGKGYHKKFGGPHAEINALRNCKQSPAGATMYVTLEPCCHYGKTPPCTNAIIKAGIKKVIAATKDPTKKVNGKGFKILKKADVKVITGICQNEAQILNAPFLKFAGTKKPWVIIKWAQSADGFLARTDKKRWITNSQSRKNAHKLRRKVQAILVGINTVLADNPMLTVRRGAFDLGSMPRRDGTASQQARPDTGRQPLRIVLDSQLKIPLNCNLIKTAKKTPICIFATIDKAKIKQKGVEIAKVGLRRAQSSRKYKGQINLKTMLAELGKRNIQQILVEGGEKVITSFLKQKLADEIIIYISNEKLAENGKVKTSKIMKKFYNRLKKSYSDKKLFGKNVRLTGFIG